MTVLVHGPPIPESLRVVFPNAIGIAFYGETARVVRSDSEEWYRMEDRGDHFVLHLTTRIEDIR